MQAASSRANEACASSAIRACAALAFEVFDLLRAGQHAGLLGIGAKATANWLTAWPSRGDDLAVGQLGPAGGQRASSRLAAT